MAPVDSLGNTISYDLPFMTFSFNACKYQMMMCLSLGLPLVKCNNFVS